MLLGFKLVNIVCVCVCVCVHAHVRARALTGACTQACVNAVSQV